jgi:hypothetical protein
VLKKTHGEANDTRIMREVTGMGLRDEQKGVKEIPSHFTKRRIYQLLSWEMG